MTSGCQVTRALKKPIPASASIGIHDERTERIGKVIQETMKKNKIPGISVAVIDHGALVWAQGLGWRDVGRRLPVDTNTQFQAGSISKAVTALGVLELETTGKLDLDVDVNRYLKTWHLESKFTNNPVTLRELLCHRAGMVPRSYLGYKETGRSRTLDEILNSHDWFYGWITGHRFGPIEVKYPPGSAFRYSGGGYTVVQKVMEDVTGEPFETAMTGLVLKPAGMSRSHYQQSPVDTNDIACGYGWKMTVLGGGRWRVYPEKAMGGLWTTPQDLARLIIAVQKAESGEVGGPISPEIAKEFLTAPYDGWQGIGIRLAGSGKNREFYHNGENAGYFASFFGSISTGRGWVIMNNGEKDLQSGPITKSIIREFGWNQ